MSERVVGGITSCHWWTEWARAWGYIPATGAGEEDTLWRCLNIPRISWTVSYPCHLIGRGTILHKWSLLYWHTVRGCPPLPSGLMKYSPQATSVFSSRIHQCCTFLDSVLGWEPDAWWDRGRGLPTLYSLLYTLHYVLWNLYSSLSTLYYVLYSLRWTLYSALRTFYFEFYTLQYQLCTLSSNSALCTQYIVYTPFSVICYLFSLFSTFPLLWILYSALFTLFSAVWTFYFESFLTISWTSRFRPKFARTYGSVL